ncbi:hypothetical protein A3K29_04620 [Candidatus Collierbacteria bacterium RIFOXYB2_FULL_46_14]|uniref:Uncharacterized protein n=1 Tax=Candidatus Collierbacteria bacterium GW2011_GWA2_46_26 TaxID=1618381 RepID=A0A0G1RT74_9BACT|nr:MAG: hypothetical protein UW29_C0005G0028 [Candidatus Collierbacteria bacterium GW2011_GWC2_44_13]KKU33138.1 MAG: hypothetical protein UX47_C0006G0109 [Candidatus Collierbacteria bacterium GW2011_GWA2_46_26]OGD73382.1 MAG: hypothetical protein A3K29_04620 [Candidatus Collierbacteria bacterium RIFOXYB2_FULL_46_14]OGD76424.1 MAG: hypothetical protein A3K43_04620 [Candidatus Collierbacteria bacterium RIFOXYA2_FULL_46_20]OGD77760.1 MAG: hypothetical protein A3K39_04620 [Candidatus Collierbacteri
MICKEKQAELVQNVDIGDGGKNQEEREKHLFYVVGSKLGVQNGLLVKMKLKMDSVSLTYYIKLDQYKI